MASASAKLADSLSELTDKARIEIDRLTSKLSLRTAQPAPVFVDAVGFSHFGPPANAAESATNAVPAWADKAQLQGATAGAVDFVKDLVKAVRRDFVQNPTETSGN